MKRKIANVLFGLLFLIGFGILVYPTVSDQWNTYRQSRLISNYETVVENLTEEDFSDEWQKAIAFDQALVQNDLYGDVFGEDGTPGSGTCFVPGPGVVIDFSNLGHTFCWRPT